MAYNCPWHKTTKAVKKTVYELQPNPQNRLSEGSLYSRLLYSRLFDLVRVVEARTGQVIEFQKDGSHEGAPHEGGAQCTDMFEEEEGWRKCVDLRALCFDEQRVKLKYIQGSIFLIISIPMGGGKLNEIASGNLVLEFVKNITDSIAFEVQDEEAKAKVSNITDIIDQINKMAVTDSLTQLLNRRFIDDKLPGILTDNAITHRPVSVAILDIDFFKEINDTYGHQAGDAALKKLAKILSTFIRRDSDFVARYGGEEFLFCFPGTPLKVAKLICERVRARIEREFFFLEESSDPPVIRITISIGVAESGELSDLTQQAIVELADTRLYAAKKAGRNKVV
ncbi:MAG: GGDEF domain-containing protein [Peptococcaceae bacterium]|nr:GGDEF domain-containing protein [Peptococcaceae bacterium]